MSGEKLDDDIVISQSEIKPPQKLTVAYYVNPENVKIYSFDLSRMKIAMSLGLVSLAAFVFFTSTNMPELSLSDFPQNFSSEQPKPNVVKIPKPGKAVEVAIIKKPVVEVKKVNQVDVVLNPEPTPVLTAKKENITPKVPGNEANFAKITLKEAKVVEAVPAVDGQEVAQTEVAVLINNLTEEKISGKVWAVASFEVPATNESLEVWSQGSVAASSVDEATTGKAAVSYAASSFTKKNLHFSAPIGAVLKDVSVFVDSKEQKQILSTKKPY